MRPDILRKKCAANNIKGLYLIPSCTNPTAIQIPIERRRALAAIIKENGLILIEDDISAWLYAADMAPVISMFDLLPNQSLYICGTTNSLCPGLRIAYMAFAEKFREQILRGLFITNIKTSSLDAEIITELILNGDAYKIAAQKRKLAEKACGIFDKYFPECKRDGQFISYYRWLPIETKKPSLAVEQELMALGVRVYHSDRFAVAQTEDKRFLRVSLASAVSMGKLEKGLKILKNYLADA
jgi:DNA-binding transcriptional MocR family regulator